MECLRRNSQILTTSFSFILDKVTFRILLAWTYLKQNNIINFGMVILSINFFWLPDPISIHSTKTNSEHVSLMTNVKKELSSSKTKLKNFNDFLKYRKFCKSSSSIKLTSIMCYLKTTWWQKFLKQLIISSQLQFSTKNNKKLLFLFSLGKRNKKTNRD